MASGRLHLSVPNWAPTAFRRQAHDLRTIAPILDKAAWFRRVPVDDLLRVVGKNEVAARDPGADRVGLDLDRDAEVEAERVLFMPADSRQLLPRERVRPVLRLDERHHLTMRRVGEDGLDATHMCVVNGTLDGIERALAAHLMPGDAVAVDPAGGGKAPGAVGDHPHADAVRLGAGEALDLVLAGEDGLVAVAADAHVGVGGAARACGVERDAGAERHADERAQDHGRKADQERQAHDRQQDRVSRQQHL